MMDQNKLEDILFSVKTEVNNAVSKHKPMNSHHEAYAVLKEEVDEYWYEVRTNGESFRKKEELIQVAAMAIRALYDLK